MVSTVTTATIVTVTTVTGSLALIGIGTLLVLLIQKELLSDARGRLAQVVGRVLNVGIIPLLILFAVILIVRAVDALK